MLPQDYVETTAVTLGYLTPGVHFATTIFGGIGNDSFTVYSNKADLFLFGEDDDDTFRIRAFVAVNPDDPNAPITNVNGGKGADFITYTVNAPVHIEGGDGFDTLTVVGTEFADKFVVTENGVFGAGLFVQYNGIENVVVDALEGNDNFYIASTAQNVSVQLIGGKGSDTFNVAGNQNSDPIAVVSNDLLGHSGLIDLNTSGNSVASGYNGVNISGISASVADNDKAGVVITPIGGALQVFEAAGAASSLIRNQYSIVLTRSPDEEVFITASAVAQKESDTRAGGNSVVINGGQNTLVFDRTNWFIPQIVTVEAPDDLLAEGITTVNIQHTVRQGSRIDDGGAYDNIAIPSVQVKVIDDDAAGLVIDQVKSQLIVSEGGAVGLGEGYANSYTLSLSRQPSGTVHVDLTALKDDAGHDQVETWLKSLDPGSNTYVYTKVTSVTFDASNWNTPQEIEIRAIDDGVLEGTQYSRITHTIRASDLAAYENLSLADVTQGLTAKVKGADLASQYTATADRVNDTITLNGKLAFTAASGAGAVIDTSASVHAFTQADVTLSTLGNIAVTAGQTWTITLDGRSYSYTSLAGDNIAAVGTGLAHAISVDLDAGFTAAADANTAGLMHISRGGEAFVARMSSSSSASALGSIDGARSADKWMDITFKISGSVAIGNIWNATLNGTVYQYVAGSNGEMVNLPSVDVTVTDKSAPGVLVTQTGGTTQVTEPTTTVQLGAGQVASTATADGAALVITTASGAAFNATVSITSSGLTGAAGLATVSGTSVWTSADIAITGSVSIGNVYTLRVNGLDYTYIAGSATPGGGTDALTQGMVAQRLASALSSLGATVVNDHIVMSSAAGVAIQVKQGGMSVSGPKALSTATVALSGTLAVGDTWRIAIAGDTHTYSYTVQTGDTLAQVAAGLKTSLGSSYNVTTKALTQFVGDFGAAVLNETTHHSSTYTAQDIDATQWSSGVNPEFGNAATPHLTIVGTGNGETDFYKFTITPQMLANGAITTTFDIDHGYELGDAIQWGSQITIYDANGNIMDRGAGSSSTSQGGTGSNTMFDDYLQHTFSQAGTYFVEVSNWMTGTTGSTGLPQGIDYELNVSIPNHDVSSFTFSPSPVIEVEQGGNPTQNIDNSDTWYTFDNPNIGNAGDPSQPSSGQSYIDSNTAYTVVRGSGDGTTDGYSFNITADMLKQSSGTIQSSTTDARPYYTSATVGITGTVATGDTWELAIGGRSYSYVVQASDHSVADIVNGLYDATNLATHATTGKPADATYTITADAVNGSISINDANGFTLEASHRVKSAGMVTQAGSVDSSSVVHFTNANLDLSGTAAVGDVWSVILTANGGAAQTYSFTATTTSLADIAAGLKNAIETGKPNTATYTATYDVANPNRLVVTDSTGSFAVQFSDTGKAPAGKLAVTGDPIQTQAEFANVKWTNASIGITGPIVANETWKITLNGTDTVSYVAGTGGYALDEHGIAAGLTAALNTYATAHSKSYSAGSVGTTGTAVNVSDASGVKLQFQVDPAATQGTLADASTWVKTVDLSAASPSAGEVYTITLKTGASTQSYTYVAGGAAGTDTLDAATVRTQLAAAINAGSSYTATVNATTGSITIVNVAKTSFNSLATRGAVNDASSWTKTATVSGVANDQVWTVALRTGSTVSYYTYVAGAGSDTANTSTVLTKLAAKINADTVYTAVVDSTNGTLTVINRAGAATDLLVSRGTEVVETGWAKTEKITGTITAGDVYTLTLKTGTNTTTSYSYAAVTGDTGADVATALASALNQTGTGYKAVVDTGTGAINIINTTATDFTVVTTRGTVSDATNWSDTLIVGGTWADNQTFTVNGKVGGVSFSPITYNTHSAVAADQNVDGMGKGLAAAINAATGLTAVYDAASKSITMFSGGSAITLSNVAITSTGAGTTGTVTKASGAATVLALSGTVATDTTWSVVLKAGTTYETFSYARQSGETLSDVITGLAGVINASTGYHAVNTNTQGAGTLSIVQTGGTSFTALTANGNSDVSAATAQTVVISGATAVDKTWTISLLTGSTYTNYSYTYTSTDTGLADVLGGLATQINAGSNYAAVVDTGSNTITVIRKDGTATTALTSVGTPAAVSTWTRTVEMAGPAAVDKTWTVSVLQGGVYKNFSYTATDTSMANTLAGLVAKINLDANYNAVANTVTNPADSTVSYSITVSRADKAGFTAAIAKPGAAEVSTATSGWSQAVAVNGTVTARETWHVNLNGGADQFSYVAQTGDTLASIAAGLAAAINADVNSNYAASYVSVSSGGYSLNILRKDKTTLASAPALTIDPASVLATEHLSGTARESWTQTIDLDNDSLQDDKWLIQLGGTAYLNNAQMGANGSASVSTALKNALQSAGYTVTVDSVDPSKISFKKADGSFVSTDKVEHYEVLKNHGAVASTPLDPSDASKIHYTNVVFELAGEVHVNDTWSITLNGITYSTHVEKVNGQTDNINGIAAKLAAQIPGGLYNVSVVNSTLTISAKTGPAAWFTGFSVGATQGSGAAPALFDIDNANLVTGVSRVSVPVVKQHYSTIEYWDGVSIQSFSYPDYTYVVNEDKTFTYVDYLTLAIYDSNGALVSRVNPYTDGTATQTGGYVDPGSKTQTYTTPDGQGGYVLNQVNADPKLYQEFAQAGTYTVQVESYRHYLDQSQSYFSDGYTGGVSTGQTYDMVVSIQNHQTNQDAVSLVGKQMVFTTGDSKGSTGTATIIAYDAATKTYTLDHKLTTSLSVNDKFEVDYKMQDELPGYTSNFDTFQVVLTNQPGDNVTVNVSPQVTETYNSDKAFSAKDNYGQNAAVQVDVATPQAVITLSNAGTTMGVSETWTLTLGTQAYNHLVTSSSETVESIAQDLANQINANNHQAGYFVSVNGATLMVTRYDVASAGFVGDHQAFLAHMTVSPDTKGGVNITRSTDQQSVSLGLTGLVTEGEAWSLKINVGASVWKTYSYVAQFGDDLATIAQKLNDSIKADTTVNYRTLVNGRVITVSLAAGGVVDGAYSITPDSKGSATVTAQLVFAQDVNAWNAWNKVQSVVVTAVDNTVIEGGDLKVFAAMDEHVNKIRGPLFIDGGVRYSEDAALNNPYMLPGEKNFPLVEGSLTGSSSVGSNTLTDSHAVYYDPIRGEMPGFDPRMNTATTGYLYTVTAVPTPGSGITQNVASLTGTTVAIKAETAGNAIGVQLIAGAGSTTGTVAGTAYTSTDLVLEGVVYKGQEWTLSLNNHNYTYIAGTRQSGAATDDVLTLDQVAQRLAETINAATGAGISATAGTAMLSLADANGVTVNVVKGRARVTGVARDAAPDWLTAEVALSGTVSTGQSWTIRVTPATTPSGWSQAYKDYTYVVGANDAKTLESVASNLASLIDQDPVLHSAVKLDTVKFTQPWSTPLASGFGYFITPVNSNLLVDESQQVDVINVYNRNSVSNDIGTLTDTRIYGLGMGPDTVIGGKALQGGITYANLEQVNIFLGSGNDTFTVESTHTGSTYISTGAGDDVINVKTISGHTTIDAGSSVGHMVNGTLVGNVINVGSDAHLVDQVTGLLSIVGGSRIVAEVDTGVKIDIVNVDDTGAINNNTGTLTSTTLTGLDMPSVQEVQVVHVQAASGTYKLGTVGGTTTVDVTFDQSTLANVGGGAAGLQTALRTLFGSNDINVTEETRQVTAGTVRSVDYVVTFVRSLAGLNMADITWAEDRTTTALVRSPDESVSVLTSTRRQGSTAPDIGNVQTFTVGATGGTFTLTLNVPGLADTLGNIPPTQTTAAIAWNASAADVQAALDPILNPNNTDNSKPYTRNVVVTKVGDVFTIAYQGQHSTKSVVAVNTSQLTGGSIEVATRTSGINYYGIKTLNVALGSGNDVFNVQSTNAITTTNLNTGAGDDRVYVSSTANVNNATGTTGFLTGNVVHFSGGDTPEMAFEFGVAAASAQIEVRDAANNLVRTIALGAQAAGTHINNWDGKDDNGSTLAAGVYSYTVTGVDASSNAITGVTAMKGNLDGIAGTLNLNAGDGSNTLMVSDVGSRNADTGVVLTNNQIHGLAAADINYITGSTGTYAGGITIWSGYGADTVTVNSTRLDTGVRTITTLNTGLGDDHVTVNLSATTDGFFALNTQGPFDHDYLGTLRTDNDVVDASASSLPLVIFGGQGNDSIIGGSGGDTIFGDRGHLEFYDANGNVVQMLGNGGLGDFTDGLVHLASRAYSVDLGVGGNDFIDAREGNNMVFGGANGGTLANGFDGDYITAGAGSDIILGDNGEVITNIAGLVTQYQTTDTVTTTGGNDTIVAGQGNNTILGGMGADTITVGDGIDTILGDNGIVQMDAAGVVFQRIASTQIDKGGNDTINTGTGKKIIVGGYGSDTINANIDPALGTQLGADSDHIILGDNGEILYVAAGQAGAGNVLSYKTTDTLSSTGGADTIRTGSGNNVILGGMGGDTITTIDGIDTILGDNGIVQMDAVGNNFASIATYTQPVLTDLGGDDTITARDGKKIVLGGDGADTIKLGVGSVNVSDHIVIGDNGEINYVAMGNVGAGAVLSYKTTDTLSSTGGADTIQTGSGNNVILGGMGGDTITTVDGVDTILGDNGIVQMDAVGNNFASIATYTQPVLTDLGGDDTITSGDGKKIVLGGDGADGISLGVGSANTSDHIVIGDNGEITYVAMGQPGAGNVLTYKTTDTLSSTGGADTIQTGSGNNVILGGMGGDTITTVDGVDTILGDNGIVQMDAVGNNFASIATYTQPTITDLGGDDTITSGDGKKIVLGGDGADGISLGVGSANTSDHIVIGDNGEITYVAMGQPGAGNVLTYKTTDTLSSTGGADTIQTGSGNNVILGGMGGDTITTIDGIDTILGDNGIVQMDAVGNNFASIATYTQPTVTDLGGNDTITSGDGKKIVLGGDGADGISVGVGSANASDHIVIGDNGEITYVAMGQPGAGNVLSYQTTDTVSATGGADTIQTGNGNNTILGGMGGDTITTGTGVDTIMGDNGKVQMDAAGLVFQSIESTQTALGGDDAINTGSGKKIVVGGFGADIINAGIDSVTGQQVGAASDHIILGDNGQVLYNAAGLVTQYQTTDTVASTGGADTIKTGDGNNVILGGMGGDTIVTGTGVDTIIGDNGIVQMDSAGNNFAHIASFTQPAVTDQGAGDSITSGDGRKTVISGDGADTVLLGVGSNVVSNHIVIGDNGDITYVAMGQPGAGNVLNVKSTDTTPATGGADTVQTGNGDNIVIGGMGSDRVTTGTGTDILLGDNGQVRMNASGTLLAQITSTQMGSGSADVINTNDGNKTVIGGDAGDTITTGTGKHVLFGDSGVITFYDSGILAQAESIAPAIGGDDSIRTGDGDTIAIGGAGSDGISTGGGNDLLFGDNASVTQDTSGRISVGQTIEPFIGGNDTLSSGNGDNALFGGFGADNLTGGAGNDQLLGDGGRVIFVEGDLKTVESIDPFVGGIDRLDGGGGSNAIIGGDGDDLVIGSLDHDVLAGDYATITYDHGHVTSVIRYGSGSDLISQAQEALFAFVRVAPQSLVTGAVFTPFTSQIDPLQHYMDAAAGYVILPSLEGFQYEESHSSGDSASSEAGAGAQQGQGEQAGQPAEQTGQPADGQPATTGDGQTNVPAEAAVPGDPQAMPLPQDPTTAQCAPGTALASGAGGALLCLPDTAVRKAQDDKSQPLNLVLGGLVGVQAWYARPQVAAAAQAKLRDQLLRQETGEGKAQGTGGKWLALPSTGAKTEVMLDRRARARTGAQPARLRAGALEKTAQRWIDTSFGAGAAVQDASLQPSPKAAGKIEWNKLPQAQTPPADKQ